MTGDLKSGFMGRTESVREREYPAQARTGKGLDYLSLASLNLVPCALIVLQEGKIVFANAAVRDLFGMGPHDVLNSTPDVFAAEPDDGRRMLRMAEESVRATRPVAGQFACMSMDGGKINCEVSFRPFSEQNRGYVLAAFQDTTGHVRVQEALKKNEKKYRDLLETIGAAYFELDASGCFTFFNSALCAGLGYPEEEVRGMNYRRFLDDGTAKRLRELFLDLYRTGRSPMNFEAEVVRRDGEKIFIEAWVSFLGRDSGAISGIQGIARDVTERRRAQLALKASEEKYRLHFTAVSDVIYTVAPDNTILSVSPSVEHFLGYTPSELEGRSFSELNLVAPEYAQTLFLNARKLFSGQKTRSSLYAFISKGGTVRYGEISASPVMHDGRVTAVLGVIRDVTERIYAEKAVAESEKRFRDIFDNVSDYLYFHDLDGSLNLDQTNKAGRAGWDYAKDGNGTINIKDIIEPKYRPEFDAYIDRVLKRGVDEGYISVLNAHKQVRVLEYRNSLVQEGGKVVGVRGSARDITDRIRAEARLRKSEEKYRTILEEIEDGYYEVDLAGNFTFFNDALCRMLGYSPEEMMGMNNRVLMDDACAKKTFRVFNRVFETGRHDKGFGWELIRKDGSRIHVETSISRMHGHEGDPRGFRGICRDITSRVQAEEERKKLESRLQQARKMEAIGALAGGVAHDLNNILSGMVSYPELILMDLPEDDPLRKPISVIRQSGEKAAAIVQDLLILARRGVSTTETVNIGTIITDYVKSPEFKKLEAEHSHVKVSVDCDEALLSVTGSPFHLAKTIVNLVTNAAEAIHDQGAISISARNAYLDAPVKGYDVVVEGEYVAVTISDTGAGISAKDRERIFEPFYTKKVMGRSGTGLGMTVVLGTVQDHRGYIESESAEGKGTTFTLYLPAAAEAGDEDPGDVRDCRGRGESIVVVDDVEVQRDIATQMLTRLGYSVRSFASGEEAVEYMGNHSADLVVLDMIMDPGIDGLETYRRILQHHPGQKAVIASGYSETSRVRELQQLGAGSYIKKPYLIEKLGKAVRAELDK